VEELPTEKTKTTAAFGPLILIIFPFKRYFQLKNSSLCIYVVMHDIGHTPNVRKNDSPGSESHDIHDKQNINAF
jgi:hypothetical protein